ncbi:TetR/AcrR family transcriptional regulator [Mycobacteroides chelonae]|uniref:TetR/AcrR family transcriptional regulator n=1 Tax=Mycobacteroides chelonae TaxID=1774 RepID=UPI001F15C320|nr:TetR/AcrR family transcriptional regulator [Mycobacteroides chelonae]
MVDVGVADTTVRAICSAADLNSRYFYECFGGLNRFFVSLFDWVVEQCVMASGASIAAAAPDLRSQVNAAVVGAVDALTADPRRARFIAYASSGNQHLIRRRAQLNSNLSLMLQAAQTHSGFSMDPVYLAVQAEALATGVTGAVLAWCDGRLLMEREELARSCAKYINQALLNTQHKG